MIELQTVTKRYGKTIAVDGLCFTVKPGRVTGFLGPNGAGKSTTMRVILGLDRPDHGQALIDGRRYHDLSDPLRRIGALLEAGAAHRGRKAFDHLHWMARSNRVEKRRVTEVLDLVGLSDVAHRRVGTFSLGMSQRLGLAAALLGDPPVLVLDEPANGLDAEGIRWLRQFLRNLAAEGRTVFVSSHLMAEMTMTADHLIVIGRGQLKADATTNEFIQRARPSRVRVRTTHADRLGRLLTAAGLPVQPTGAGGLLVSDAAAGQVGQIAADHGIVLDELGTETVSLEDAFMQILDDPAPNAHNLDELR